MELSISYSLTQRLEKSHSAKFGPLQYFTLSGSRDASQARSRSCVRDHRKPHRHAFPPNRHATATVRANLEPRSRVDSDLPHRPTTQEIMQNSGKPREPAPNIYCAFSTRDRYHNRSLLDPG